MQGLWEAESIGVLLRELKSAMGLLAWVCLSWTLRGERTVRSVWDENSLGKQRVACAVEN